MDAGYFLDVEARLESVETSPSPVSARDQADLGFDLKFGVSHVYFRRPGYVVASLTVVQIQALVYSDQYCLCM